ncbi:MAG: nuclear transport factor 2 family protein [Myxococcales bacterium]|nr:nuclear transport factor 2 family protein [Myxococcota bacterium]MDW8280344.1 nuclear transport factor 2 family protein [Myxococcales bacterium]
MNSRSLSPDEPDVLAANGAFYEAFARRDLPAMDHLWARRVPVACIHPGWDVLRGREQVMESWRAILGQGEGTDIRCSGAVAHILGEVALVTCHERLAGGQLVATNVFVREEGQWKIAHHQAAPLTHDEEGEEDAPPGWLLN